MSQAEDDFERRKAEALKDLHDHPLMTNRTWENKADVRYKDEQRTVPQTFGGQTWDAATQRYRDIAGQQQAPIALDQTQADQARGMQMGSLGMLENAARGGAPSQAAILGRANVSNALGAGMAAQGAARGGPGAQIASARAGMAGTAAQGLAANVGSLGMAGSEMAHDQNAFAGASQAARAQDIGAATTNAQLEAQRRALQQQHEQAFERLGFNTRKAQLDSGMEKERQYQGAVQHLQQVNAAEVGQASNDAAAGTSAVVGAWTGGASLGAAAAKKKLDTSDERAKTDIVPMGSLSHLMPRRGY